MKAPQRVGGAVLPLHLSPPRAGRSNPLLSPPLVVVFVFPTGGVRVIAAPAGSSGPARPPAPAAPSSAARLPYPNEKEQQARRPREVPLSQGRYRSAARRGSERGRIRDRGRCAPLLFLSVQVSTPTLRPLGSTLISLRPPLAAPGPGRGSERSPPNSPGSGCVTGFAASPTRRTGESAPS